LIELLTVIAIIGILAAATIYGLSGARENAKDKALVADMNQILIEASLYRSNTGDYDDFCTSTTTRMDELLTTIHAARSPTGHFDCDDESVKFGVIVELYRKDGGNEVYYCVDSTKFFGERTQQNLVSKHCPGT